MSHLPIQRGRENGFETDTWLATMPQLILSAEVAGGLLRLYENYVGDRINGAGDTTWELPVSQLPDVGTSPGSAS